MEGSAVAAARFRVMDGGVSATSTCESGCLIFAGVRCELSRALEGFGCEFRGSGTGVCFETDDLADGIAEWCLRVFDGRGTGVCFGTKVYGDLIG